MFLYSSFFTSHFSFLISSKRLTILVLVLVFEHGQITLVSAGGNEVIFHRLDDSTTRFVGMRTVGKTTVLGEMEDFLEITGQFFFLDIKRTEALDARSIYQIPPSGSSIISLNVVVCIPVLCASLISAVRWEA